MGKILFSIIKCPCLKSAYLCISFFNPVLKKIRLLFALLRNMGIRYILFRMGHEFLRRTGMLIFFFPVKPEKVKAPSLKKALSSLQKWPWESRDSIQIPVRTVLDVSGDDAEEIMQFRLRLFSSTLHQYSGRDDWHRHPETGYLYDSKLHWTKIPDLSPEAGDIKFVWERARFVHIQAIMRYDLHSGLDHSAWVFEEIDSFIRENPINCGPHYRCSQEISLRVMNWLGAISFYRNSPVLNEERWLVIWQYLYWQVHHVRQNIHFSRISVRNNHAITETLMLYIFGTIFPDAPQASEWKNSGKKWFEEEIAYQIYPDGSYLQFSMNYHRVVVQLLTLGIRFAEKAGERFSRVVYDRAGASLNFLRFFQDEHSGWLPNYGANDGALFFRFSSAHLRDYRPQLEALELALGKKGKAEYEDGMWFGKSGVISENTMSEPLKVQLFPSGGYAGIRQSDSLLFFRCGSHRDRPSQADNLHMDLWYGGKNILRDSGSYKYNGSAEDVRFFFGTESHNAVMLDGADQMLKGPRFVWLHWSQALSLESREEEDAFVLSGEISAFGQLADDITQKRTIRVNKNQPEWEVKDTFSGDSGRVKTLLWHPGPDFHTDFLLEVRDGNGHVLEPEIRQGWYSALYGQKEPADYWAFTSSTSLFSSRIIRRPQP